MSEIVCLEELMRRVHPRWQSDFLSKDFRYAQLSSDKLLKPNYLGLKPHRDCGKLRYCLNRKVLVPLHQLLKPSDKVRFIRSLKYDVHEVHSSRMSIFGKVIECFLYSSSKATIPLRTNLLYGAVFAEGKTEEDFPLDIWLTIKEDSLPSSEQLRGGNNHIKLWDESVEPPVVWLVSAPSFAAVREIEVLKEST